MTIRFWRTFLVMVIAGVAMLASQPARAQPKPTTLPSSALYAPILPSQVDRIYQETAGRISTYTVSADLSETASGTYQINGHLSLDFYNLTGTDINQVPFRLYPNYLPYQEGALLLNSAEVNGAQLLPEMSLDNTLAMFDLPSVLPAAEFATFDIDFTTTIPVNPPDTYGMFEVDTEAQTINMAHWQPLLAGWDREFGWNLLPVDTRGDPVFTNAALFDITLAAPASLQIASSGSEADHSMSDDVITHHWVSGPSRDFVMMAGSTWETESTEVGGVTINSYFVPEHQAAGHYVLKIAANALQIYDDLLGVYPYRELDVVEARLGSRAAGIEFPGLVLIGSNYYDPSDPFLEFTTAHEVGHQWFYGVVGNNQYQHAFLDESLTNYLATVYLEKEYGPESGNAAVDSYLKSSYFAALFGKTGDEIVDQPTADFISDRSYGRIVYGKGALGFQAIRNTIGNDAFFSGLQAYKLQQEFQVALPIDLLTVFEQASGQDLSALWNHWFLSPDGADDFSPDDLQKILDE